MLAMTRCLCARQYAVVWVLVASVATYALTALSVCISVDVEVARLASLYIAISACHADRADLSSAQRLLTCQVSHPGTFAAYY